MLLCWMSLSHNIFISVQEIWWEIYVPVAAVGPEATGIIHSVEEKAGIIPSTCEFIS